MIEFREEARNDQVSPAVMQSASFSARDETSAGRRRRKGGGWKPQSSGWGEREKYVFI